MMLFKQNSFHSCSLKANPKIGSTDPKENIQQEDVSTYPTLSESEPRQ